MKRKITIVAVCLLTLACVIGLMACDGGGKEGRLEFKLSKDKKHYIVTGMTGSAQELVIPSIHNNKPVKEIAERAFIDCSALTKITIPDSIVVIGSGAFENCGALTIYCQADEERSGWDDDWNYSNCPVIWDCDDNATTWNGIQYAIIDGIRYGLKTNADKNKIANVEGQPTTISESIEIPATVTFKDETYAVKRIASNAFKNCDKVTEVIISEGIESIGISAFENCRALMNVSLPDSVREIEKDAFKDCPNLVQTENGVSYVDNWAISADTSVTKVALRKTTVGVGGRAFTDCVSLTDIVIPDSVNFISGSSLYGCASLKSVTIPFVGAAKDGKGSTSFYHLFEGSIPASLKTAIVTGGETIADRAFDGCDSLTNIILPDGLLSIGEYAFSHCRSLTEITIPDSVTTIDKYAFYRCNSIESVTLPFIGESKDGKGNTRFGYLFSDFPLPNSSLPPSLKTVVLTGGEKIGFGAFDDCSNITSITLPDTLKTIGALAFSSCTSLSSITIPKSVTAIEENAFNYCTSLKSIVIPKSVEVIHERAFDSCDLLSEVFYRGTVNDWNAASEGFRSSQLLSAARYYYSYSRPTAPGKFWHYAADGETPVKW